METPRSNKRAQLVEAAGNLVHRRGFNRTTLADIAAESGIRLGNVYYYFKTKAAIGEAIVEQRASDYRALLGIWNKLPAAEDRLEALGLALFLGNPLLEEVEIGRDLNLDQIRRLDDFAELAEVDAFRMSAVGHEISR